MQHQQDKDFDARLREKMEDFSVTPPAGLWDAIDGKMNGPAAPPVKRKLRGAAWLKIAASVCLLAAAGIWLYRYESPFTNEAISVNGKKDSIASPETKVTIVNKSRSHNEDDGNGAGEKEEGEKITDQTGSSLEKAGQKESGQADTEGKAVVSEGSGQNGTAPESSGQNGTAPESSGQNRTAPESSGQNRTTAQPRAAQPDPEQTEGTGDDTVQPVEKDVDTRGNAAVLAAAPGLLPEKENMSNVRAEPDLEPLDTESSGIKSSDREAAKEGRGILAAAFGRGGTKPAGTSAGEGERTNSVLPEELREVSGVGEALNLVASTIDRSEDKFIRVRKDEESGKWEGVRLDLGIVTISYNKPSKKNRQERN